VFGQGVGVQPDLHPARRLWLSIEPLHAIVYFAREPAEAAKAVGLKGWWMGYFAGRAAPLGPVGPHPVTAMFFGFAPRMVERALPDAWSFADPAAVLSARLDAATAALHRAVPAPLLSCAEELAGLLDTAVAGCDFGGRPLAAAWAGWAAAATPTDPVARVWAAASVLREHRGDGHVAAAVALGLPGLETSLTAVAAGNISREVYQPTRGWTEEEWDAGVDRLRERGLLREDGALSPAGWAVRHELEATTDTLAHGPVRALGADGVERVAALAGPVARHLFETGAVPNLNPIGVPKS
jgi:hypothetical protein